MHSCSLHHTCPPALLRLALLLQPAGWPNVSTHDDLLAIFTLTSFALSLLMLFKTTSSYGRWWEARTLLGSGYITVRSVLRLCMSCVGRQHPDLIPPIFRWTAAIMPALAAHVRGRNHYLEEHLQAVMHPGELRWLLERGEGRSNPAVAALQVLSRLLDRAGLPVIERQQIEMLLSHCDVVVGASERIRSQPIPRAWNRCAVQLLC
jgi:predicted membrane chloride channel (bestrophin family)